jgi:tetratricopeptide (TPR) repeat protein
MMALIWRKKHPVFSLGLLWFFAGHLMESTVIPLEIAYEHRNYLPMLGVLLAIVHVINYGCYKLGHRKLWGILPAFMLLVGGTTYVRAEQWSTYQSFYLYEVLHHPDSARTQSGLSLVLEASGKYAEAMEASRRAAEIEVRDAGYMMNVYLLAARQGITLGEAEQKETLKRLTSYPITATTLITIERIGSCLQTWCKTLRIPMETWLRTLLQRTDAPDRPFLLYQLGRNMAISGRFSEALEYFRMSSARDPMFLHPMFEQANIYLHSGDLLNAEDTLLRLREANKKTTHPRDREIEELAVSITKLKETGNWPEKQTRETAPAARLQ